MPCEESEDGVKERLPGSLTRGLPARAQAGALLV